MHLHEAPRHAHISFSSCVVSQYVDGLLADIVSFQPELQQVLQQLHDQVDLAAQASEAEARKFTGTGSTANRKQTKPAPFNLTQPKPKLQPIEEPLPPPIKYDRQSSLFLDKTKADGVCTLSWMPSRTQAGSFDPVWDFVALARRPHLLMHSKTRYPFPVTGMRV